jgi:uncharacterized protein
MKKKYVSLVKIMKEKKRVAIAFSGGVDSTLVALAAKEAGIDAMLITMVSPLLSAYETKKAIDRAHKLGIDHLSVPRVLPPEVVRNRETRCSHCKKEEADMLKSIAKKHAYNIVADGANFDDMLSEDRPGVKASSKKGIWHPLAEMKMTKKDIREILQDLAPEMWNEPSNSCLATRIAFGENVTAKKLSRIEKAEDFLRKISSNVRVRLHKSIVRIEVDRESMSHIIENKKEIIRYLKSLGFVYITLDLEGYRSGSMHEELKSYT